MLIWNSFELIKVIKLQPLFQYVINYWLLPFLCSHLPPCKYPEAYALEQTLLVQKIASKHRGSDFVFVEEPDAKAELWKVGRAFNLKRQYIFHYPIYWFFLLVLYDLARMWMFHTELICFDLYIILASHIANGLWYWSIFVTILSPSSADQEGGTLGWFCYETWLWSYDNGLFSYYMLIHIYIIVVARSHI